MGQSNGDAAQDHRGCAERIAEHVKERGAYVEVALAARTQQQANCAVDGKSSRGDGCHQRAWGSSGIAKRRAAS